MTKSLAITLSLILVASLGIFSAFQIKKLNATKTHLATQIKNVSQLEENLTSEKEEREVLNEINIDLQDENQILRDSIAKLHRVIARLRNKVNQQDDMIAKLQEKINFLEKEYSSKKKEIAVLSRKEVVDQQAIAKIEAEKAVIKDQMNTFQTQQSVASTVKMVTENEIEDKMQSEERFRKIVDVVNNTRIKFQDIKVKMDATGKPVTRLISEGKNWKHTNIEFFMNHENRKVLLDEEFMVKIIDMDFQEELSFIQRNPLTPKSNDPKPGAPFYYDGNLIEIDHINNQPKKGKNFEIQVYYKSQDGEEYLLLDGVKQFIRDGHVVASL